MTITFSPPKPAPSPSLAYRLSIDGRIRFLPQRQGFWITAEDNEELITVHVAVKRRTAVTEDLTSRTVPVHFRYATT